MTKKNEASPIVASRIHQSVVVELTEIEPSPSIVAPIPPITMPIARTAATPNNTRAQFRTTETYPASTTPSRRTPRPHAVGPLRSTIESPSARTMPAIASALPDVNEGAITATTLQTRNVETGVDPLAARVRPEHHDRQQGQTEWQPGMRRPGDHMVQTQGHPQGQGEEPGGDGRMEQGRLVVERTQRQPGTECGFRSLDQHANRPEREGRRQHKSDHPDRRHRGQPSEITRRADAATTP